MTITLAICIPITALVVGFLVLKSVHLGLKWQIQANKGETPTMEIPNPVAPIVEARQEKALQKQEAEQKTVLHEYLYGAEE